MGNIANKIDAEDKKLSQVLNGQRYRIDSFQREFRWQRKHIEALISDLSLSFKKNYKKGHTVKDCSNYDCYYMGPIVLCEVNSEHSIVDGQQRLTSFTLLFIYLFHLQNKIEQNNIVLRDLKPFLYVTKAGEKTFVLNVTSRIKVLEHLIENPNTIFTDIQDLENNVIKDQDDTDFFNLNDESIQNLIGRYEDLTVLFPEDLRTTEILPIFIEWLLEKVVIVEVKAYTIENAYTIFETMNDRGMTLNPTEILKAFLLHKINDDEKSNEVNEFWKERISEIKSTIGDESELDFFRAWLRAKYAESKRDSKAGSENEDFELIGTQFNSWVKNNPKKVNLINSADYYFFIRSDFDFYSNLYIQLYSIRNYYNERYENLYLSNFYPIADSLTYPLLISPISKIDEEEQIYEKIILIGNFIDNYTIYRTLMGKAITQSSIRNFMYDIVKSIRNMEINLLAKKLSDELVKSLNILITPTTQFQKMDNWGFYHYFFARIIFYLKNDKTDFRTLMRNRKQSSYVLTNIFNYEDRPDDIDIFTWSLYFNSIANYCLVKRWDLIEMSTKKPLSKVKFLIKNKYLLEMTDYNLTESGVIDFITQRDSKIRLLIDDIWKL